MPFALAPHHVQLINACYPPSSAIPNAGPEYKPNSQELSRLAYYASNRPGKIAKLASDLEKRTVNDARKAGGGNVKSRALLLITLNIFKNLVEECRRDLSLLAPPLVSALDTTLASLPNDLEVCAKVASVLTGWATFTNGNLLGVDQILTQNYLSCLRRFSSLATSEDKNGDKEYQNRKRIVGLSALTAAVGSEALYNSSSQFKAQVSTIVPALLYNVLSLETSVLERESENNSRDNIALTHFLSDFRSRPLLERRAASIHLHVDGEEGPTDSDVAHSALRAMSCLLSQSSGPQVSLSVQALLDSLGIYDGWADRNRCCWICRKAIEWVQYQYRYIVPMRLVDRLQELQGDPIASDLHRSLAAMIRTAFTVPVPLVNLSTSDVCAGLTTLLLRRINRNPDDDFLPDIVSCVGTLGTHIYYADQIHDLACEIISRLSNIEANGLGGSGRAYGSHDRKREMALRCLTACLGQLIEQSSKPSHQTPTTNGHGHRAKDSHASGSTAATASEAETATQASTDIVKPPRVSRSKISPEVWQETLSLLCDENFSVRSDYVRVLMTYIKTEIQHEPVTRSVDGTDPTAPKGLVGPMERAHSLYSVGFGENATSRFLNALHVALYVLATSPRLGLPPLSSPPSRTSEPEEELELNASQIHVNVVPSTPQPGQSFTSVNEARGDAQASDTSPNLRRKSLAASISPRKACRIRRILEWSNTNHFSDQQSDESSACLTDFTQILQILEVTHEHSAPRSLLAGVPMLLAMHSWCKSESPAEHRQAAVGEVVSRHCKAMSQIWDLEKLDELLCNCEDASSFPYPPPDIHFPHTCSATPLADLKINRKELGDLSSIPSMFASDERIQALTGLDESHLEEKLSVTWSPEDALQASVETHDHGGGWRSGHVSPRLKISPGLMHISNLSLQSLNRSNRGVGVNELRDALEGRHSMSNLALTQDNTASVASLGFSSAGASGESAFSPSAYSITRSKSPAFSGDGPKDVKKVLDRLGVGSLTSPSRSPLSLPPTLPQTTYLIPPYKG